MPITPEEHNQKRRVTKQKQRANARAAAAHKRRKEEGNEAYDGVVEATFSSKTISSMNRNHFVQKSGSVSERTIYRMVADGEVSVDVIKDEAIFYPREIKITRDGFKPVDGKDLPLEINRMKVVLGGGVCVVFNYRFNKSLDKHRMEIGYEFKVPGTKTICRC